MMDPSSMPATQLQGWRAIALQYAVQAFSFASMATIGLSLVVTSWVAAELGSISLVGQLFFIGSATSLLFSIFAGVIVDTRNRYTVVQSGQALRLLGGAILVSGFLAPEFLRLGLFAYTLFFSLGTILNAGAVEGIVQRAVAELDRMKLTIRVSIARQVGMLCGTGLGGVLMHNATEIASVATMIGLMLFQFVLIFVFFAPYQNTPSKTSINVILSWKQGLKAIWQQSQLLLAIASVGLFFSTSQMANVLMPGFVKYTLNQGSDIYGLLETAWAVGGGAMLATAAVQSRLLKSSLAEFAVLALIGVLMIVFASSRNIPLLVALYAGLGGLFALGRAICDGRILILARNEEIGRVRAATTMLISLFGMMIYISPTLLGLSNPTPYYIAWGAVMTLCGLFLIAFKAKRHLKQQEVA
ncbi:MFS transporter [Roseibium hamelinense]|nr:MFS transporter [Roseibium hamelinense]